MIQPLSLVITKPTRIQFGRAHELGFPKAYVDFHNADPLGRVRLNCMGTVQSLSERGIVLRAGLQLTLSDLDELEADAVVTFSEDDAQWVARIDWSAIRSTVDRVDARQVPNERNVG